MFMAHQLRPPAVPLITHDPYFSIWSCSDELYGNVTRHWTGAEHPMNGLLFVDGNAFRFCGNGFGAVPAMTQTSRRVRALSTEYGFTAAGVELAVRFTSPLLPKNPERMSAAISYVDFEIKSVDQHPHAIRLFWDIGAELCVDVPTQPVIGSTQHFSQAVALQMGHADPHPLSVSGDDKRIDWGHGFLVVPDNLNARSLFMNESQRQVLAENGRFEGSETLHAISVNEGYPSASVLVELDTVDVDKKQSFYLAVAYDDEESITYFGEKLAPYWKKDGQSFDDLLNTSIEEKDEIIRQCCEFEQRLEEQARQCGGQQYAELLSLAYRQAVAGHKVVWDKNEGLLFFSKECFSNGCIATCDVSYPSIPLFLWADPSLLRGMLQPVIRYAESGLWPYPFAPHDIGQYPLANGQVYGLEDGKLLLEKQMPVEECGNMLIMCYAYGEASGDWSYLQEHLPLLKQWADYLVETGFDPVEQLCTDDFAGHLAHNCNLSVKGIVGVECFSKIVAAIYLDGADPYHTYAVEAAKQWVERAQGEGHTRLTFDSPDSWSLKYNLVWDDLFGLGLFPIELKEREVDWYRSIQNQYGVALDCRKDYTKADWIVWAASLTSHREKFEEMVEPLWHFANETSSRAPMPDWYDSKTGRMVTYPVGDGKEIGFTARTVVGGLFIWLLKSQRLGCTQENKGIERGKE